MDQQSSRLACDEDPTLLSSQSADQLWPSLSGMRASWRKPPPGNKRASQTHSKQGSSAIDGADIKP